MTERRAFEEGDEYPEFLVDGSDRIHVMPIDDMREHDAGLECWCGPTPDDQECRVIVHHSMDEREKFETGERKPS